jgi:ATPase components of various ABC-type transport systems, contain duplicated ATPase
MLLDIQNLSIEVLQNGSKHTLCKDLTFSIGPGESIGILGESGSGKSLTALSILQILPPTISISQGKLNYSSKSGEVTDLATATSKKLQNIRGKEIAMVFQEPMTSLNPSFTCGSQVLETILQHQKISKKDAKEKVLELFSKVKLPDPVQIFNSYPHQLSGGQKQRVMIAIAISCNPRLLIADEPTTALDVTVQQSILQLLKELQQELGMSILFITHDISVIAEIAQRLLVFYKGEIVEQGSVNEILNYSKHSYTKGLLACRTSSYTKGQRLKTLEHINQPESNNDNDFSSVSSTDPAPILKIHDLNVFFSGSQALFGSSNKKQILHRIDFGVFRGETLGLVGESGSGKTTIGRSIMKLIDYESGDIEFEGNRLSLMSTKEVKKFRKEVQIIFQDPYSSLNPKITIGEMITEPLQVHGLYKNHKLRKQRVLELLAQVGLNESHYSRYPHQFSGGQRQRIGIARALAVEPKLIILDESVSALDVSIQAQILNLLNDLKKIYNLTFIFISHDLNTVRYMADRLIVLQHGKVVEQGQSEEVFSKPKTTYTQNLISAIPGKPS